MQLNKLLIKMFPNVNMLPNVQIYCSLYATSLGKYWKHGVSQKEYSKNMQMVRWKKSKTH